MRRLLATLSLVVLVAVLALASGCVDSSQEEAQTPSDAPTVANSALQTDSSGKTITAPAATAPAGGGGTAPAGGGSTAPAGGGGGDVAAGMQIFSQTCTSCHMNNGMDAGGIGPKLAGAGLDDAYVTGVLMNGIPGTAMVGGLVTGTDLENVKAYVLSLQ